MSFLVLSVDGGGIRGAMPALILQALARDVSHEVVSGAQYYVGTSTGCLATLGLAGGVSMEEVVGTYVSAAKCAQIFSPYMGSQEQVQDGIDHHRTILYEAVKLIGEAAEVVHHTGFFSVLADLLFPAYTHEGLRKIIVDHHLPEKLSDFGPKVFVPAFRITATPGQRWETVAFHNLDGDVGLGDYPHIPTVDAVLASTSAPMGFPPHRYQGDLFVDGGVMARNPTMLALAAAKRAGLIGPGTAVPYKDVTVLSLGTGYSNSTFSPDTTGFPPPFGVLGWQWPKARGRRTPSSPQMNAMGDGHAEVTDYQVRSLLGEDSYYRIQIDLGDVAVAMNECSALPQLEKAAGAFISGPNWEPLVQWLRGRLGFG